MTKKKAEVQTDTIQTYFDCTQLHFDIRQSIFYGIQKKIIEYGYAPISPTMIDIVFKLGNSQHAESIGAFIQRACIESKNINYAFSKLILFGYVRKTQHAYDKRSRLIELTPKGCEVYTKIREISKDQICSIFDKDNLNEHHSSLTNLIARINKEETL